MANLNYKIALISVFWNENGIDTRFHNSVAEQITYFEAKAGGQYSPLVNFNIGNNISTDIIFNDTTSRDIEKVVASNYAVVKLENAGIISYRYFFAYVAQDSGRQMKVTLSLDDIQTNYFKYKSNIKYCTIMKACLNRFIDLGNNEIAFDGSPTSNLFEDEGFNLSKRLIKREKLKFKVDLSTDQALNNWLDSNIAYWNYIYIKGDHDYNVFLNNASTTYNPGFTSYKTNIVFNNLTSFHSGWSIIALPIMKKENGPILTTSNGTNDVFINSDGLKNFRESNKDASYFYASKISCVPPLWTQSYSGYEITEDYLILDLTKDNLVYNLEARQILGPTSSGNGVLFVEGSIYDSPYITRTYITDVEYKFSKSDLKTSNKNKRFNPKLLSSSFRELRLTNGVNGITYYDYQKLNINSLNFEYFESIFPDITRQYACFIPPANNIYTQESRRNYTGLVASIDNQLPYNNDQLQSFLASNKNFYLQRDLATQTQAAKSLIRTGTQVGMGLATGNPVGVVAGASNAITSAIDITANRIQSNMTLDNMDNAPDSLHNVNGNAIFNAGINEPGLYIEEYQALERELDIVNDLIFRTGFTYNRIGFIGDFDNIRKFFNYLEASIEVIDAPISNIEKTRLINRLAKVRFWNSDEIQYTYENYERWLDE